MRLHRLVLTNYRGISHREIAFAERGVTVVCGANEIGKSSMIEALDLLLESKDRSTKKDVKQVKPTHADVGAEVTAEISTGPYRFVYRKRFHKKCETELTILSPKRFQLTGDEAHERVRAMLAETVDTGLWQAQRVLQSGSTSAVDLSGCDALSRALDVAAGDSGDGLAAGLSGTEPVLVDKIDAEYARYFTATGRPTGEWALAAAALAAADQEVAQCTAAVAEVDDRVRMHTVLSDELKSLVAQRAGVTDRRTAAEAAAAAVKEVADELRTARTEAGALSATSAASAAALQQRTRLCEEVGTRESAVVAAEQAAAEAAEAEETGRAVVTAADEALAKAVEDVRAAEERANTARRVVVELADREEAVRLGVRLKRIGAVEKQLAGVLEQLAAIPLTELTFRDIETAATTLSLAQAQAELTSAGVEFVAASDIVLESGDAAVPLATGGTWAFTLGEQTSVTIPGIVTVRLAPGATAADMHAKLVAAHHVLDELLTKGGVQSLDQARTVDQQRRDLTAEQERLRATLAGIRGDDDVDLMRARLSTLTAAQPTVTSDLDIDGARAELVAAERELTTRNEQCATHRKVAAAAGTQLAERSTRTKVSADRAAAARVEFEAAVQRLTAERAAVSDDDVAARATEHTQAAQHSQALVAMLTGRLAAATPDAVAAELTAARSAADELHRRHDATQAALRDIAVELSVFGTEGRTGKLDAAKTKREHAVAAYGRVQARARAVHLLRSVMARHRDDTRLRYVEPFRTEVERLGRTVFGPTFEVEIDSNLQICNRTLDGRTVPFESLSGGAKEQLGIIARLAVAALVAKEDTVPVVIDDALGFTDPDRLAKMGAVFDLVGADGQVIVLTCAPERYGAVIDAHRVQLTA